MESTVFLAVTAHEMEEFLPQKLAYMACHFSPYSTGLSNLPDFLPKGSILLLDDSMPVQGHDPQLVARQLQELATKVSPTAVLLDFQNDPTDDGFHIIRSLLGTLPCPVAVTKQYASVDNCPVFLPPPPVNVSISEYLAPWMNRGVYLEIAPDSQQITVTEQGAHETPLPSGTVYNVQQQDPRLHCHYRVEVFSQKAVFTLQRTKEDVLALVQEALHLGVHGVVGLYQELGHI